MVTGAVSSGKHPARSFRDRSRATEGGVHLKAATWPFIEKATPGNRSRLPPHIKGRILASSISCTLDDNICGLDKLIVRRVAFVKTWLELTPKDRRKW
jgi:hypothetical protein